MIRPILVCDGGYGLPKEARPRAERLNAVTRQVVNFLQWQRQQQDERQLCGVTESFLSLTATPDDKEQKVSHEIQPALVKMIGWDGSNNTSALQQRIQKLLAQETKVPTNDGTSSTSDDTCSFPIEFSDQTIEDFCGDDSITPAGVVYLSPDAEQSLDPSQPPPRMVIVGMVVDRRVRPLQSRNRAERFRIPTYRLPLDEMVVVVTERNHDRDDDDDDDDDDDKDKDKLHSETKLDIHEPLNIDTVLELMQRWWWNCDDAHDDKGRKEKPDGGVNKDCFFRALQSSLEHHQHRHPGRPLHKQNES